ncbi:lipopolysaccharide biosynthesis protein [Geodermatophilus sp. SYSU D00703]
MSADTATPARSDDGAVDGRALGRSAARGVLVALTGQGLRIGVQVLSVVLLSRLLGPTDYGLLAMVMAVIGVADVFRDLGLSTAAVQAPSLSVQQRSNLFWVNTGTGALLSVLAVAAAPLVEALYGRPELGAMTQALAAVFLLNGVATQYRADLTRHLRFGRLAVVDVSAPAAGLVAGLGLAATGAGYWALVGQQLAQYLVMTVMVVLAGRWVPRWPDRRTPMDGLLRFGWHMVGIELLGYASRNADSLLIGTRSGAAALGLYNRAYQLLMAPLGQVRAPITQVALPVLSRLHDDPERWAAYVRRGQQALGYTLVAGLAVVVGAAEPITAVFLGDQWLGVAPVLRLMAVGGACQMLAFVGYWVYLSRGLTSSLIRYSLFETAVRLVCIVVGSGYGVVGVAAGFALAPALTWPVSLWWLSRLAPLPLRQLVTGALRILGLACAVAVAAYAAVQAAGSSSPLLALVAAVAAGTVVYLLVAAVARPVRRDVGEVVRAVRAGVRHRAVTREQPLAHPAE